MLARIVRLGDDRFAVDLGDDERALLVRLVDSLRDMLLEGPSEATRRLFPPAHANDAKLEAEYRELVGDSILEKRLADLDVVERSASATELDEEAMTAWLGAINGMRLVLGTNLDLSEDLDVDALSDDDPRLPGLAVYQLLTEYLGEIVDALAGWDPQRRLL